MTQKITISMKTEKKAMLERLAKERNTSVASVVEQLVDEAAKTGIASRQPLLGDLLASFSLKSPFANATESKGLLSVLREQAAAKR